jgi:hypothetical protein
MPPRLRHRTLNGGFPDLVILSSDTSFLRRSSAGDPERLSQGMERKKLLSSQSGLLVRTSQLLQPRLLLALDLTILTCDG